MERRDGIEVISCHVFSLAETCDTLRIPEKCQDCRYAKKTQLSLDLKNY
jgi:hypothetical protein